MANSVLYVRTLFVGLVFTLIYNIGSGILRAIGDSKRPLYILIACCGLNIALDVLFVVKLKLGVFGAGLATDISQAFSAFLITYLLMKKTPNMKLSMKRMHINFNTLGLILKIGLPTAIAGSMFSVSNMIVQTSLNQMGVSVVAAWTAYGRVDALWWMVNQAFSVSITTFVLPCSPRDKIPLLRIFFIPRSNL
jgi:Na+-driven multidrug efflux pump